MLAKHLKTREGVKSKEHNVSDQNLDRTYSSSIYRVQFIFRYNNQSTTYYIIASAVESLLSRLFRLIKARSFPDKAATCDWP